MSNRIVDAAPPPNGEGQNLSQINLLTNAPPEEQ